MAGLVSPPLNEIPKLRQPLTAGEKETLNFLVKHLPHTWEIYIQPHMNGLCPDFVLLNPWVGIIILEVKDWNLKSMDYRWEGHGNNPPKLIATNNQGKTFKLKSPYDQLMHYKEEILELYLP
ncbi:hypothetical protein GCM10023116_19720 [Kistimonas scapharcae]|uniref:NERD domain-containing protein n=1 Tax=Kistimonas scapharcae TaxID=1036133 RepID=A0ABP8V0H2_9GAMM